MASHTSTSWCGRRPASQLAQLDLVTPVAAAASSMLMPASRLASTNRLGNVSAGLRLDGVGDVGSAVMLIIVAVRQQSWQRLVRVLRANL